MHLSFVVFCLHLVKDQCGSERFNQANCFARVCQRHFCLHFTPHDQMSIAAVQLTPSVSERLYQAIDIGYTTTVQQIDELVLCSMSEK